MIGHDLTLTRSISRPGDMRTGSRLLVTECAVTPLSQKNNRHRPDNQPFDNNQSAVGSIKNPNQAVMGTKQFTKISDQTPAALPLSP